MTNLRLEVGKTYNHDRTGSKDRWTIVSQWGPELFEGVPHGRTFPTVMFNSAGHAIGSKNSGCTVQNWRLAPGTEYEVTLLYKDGNLGRWERVKDRGVPWTPGTLYVVREEKNNDTAKLMNHNQFTAFVDDLFEEQD